MAGANKKMSSVFLELRKSIGDDGSLVTDRIEIHKVSTFNLLNDVVKEKCKVTAVDISYRMQMYEPDHFTVRLSVIGNNLPMAAVAQRLMGAMATIKYAAIGEEDDYILSRNLFVYQAIPSIDKHKENELIDVQLELYSYDKLIDLQKFCQAFTGLPLGKILTDDALMTYVPKHEGKQMYALQTAKNLHIMEYTIGKEPHEVIQPYLSQYNETFRSMLNRTANRCGEFLYWHEGKLQYGLHESDTTVTLDDDADRVTLSAPSQSMFDALSVTESHRNSTDPESFMSNGEVNYDLETGSPDYNNTLPFVYGSKRKYSKTRNFGATFGLSYVTDPSDEHYDEVDKAVSDSMVYVIGNFLSGFAASTDFFEFITETLVDITVSSPIVNQKMKAAMDDVRQALNFQRLASPVSGDRFGFEPQEQIDFKLDAKGNIAESASSIQDYDRLESTKKLSPFSTLRTVMENPSELLDDAVMGNAFYSKVRTLGNAAAQGAIDVTLLSDSVPLNVGDRIKVKGVTYLVTGINGTCNSDNKICVSTTIHAIPESKVGDTTMFLPVPLSEQNRRMDGNSTAIITDNKDPYGEGRVRVRFQWQGKKSFELTADDKKACFIAALSEVYKDLTDENAMLDAYTRDKGSAAPDAKDRIKQLDEKQAKYETQKAADVKASGYIVDSTPWIRMASPIAGKANIYLKPSVGDEVIVGFENGNPERPYVLGSLHNIMAQVPGGQGITMTNGHGITFEDENMNVTSLIGSLISPVASRILTAADPDMNWKINNGKMGVGGKVSIRDKYGFYEMTMSSAQRAVSISCPLGNVSISAFTGISIAAPNGDISIMGKNVNITAGNKLTLLSGTNADVLETGVPDLVGMVTGAMSAAALSAIGLFAGSLKVVDLKTARALWEVVFRPVNGSLTLKSMHHLMLEAGNGKVEMPVNAIKAKNSTRALSRFPNYPYYLLTECVSVIEEALNAKVAALQRSYDLLRACKVREDDADLDKDEAPKENVYIHKMLTDGIPVNTTLSQKKFNQILSEGVTQKNKVWVVDEGKISDLCPIPEDSSSRSGWEGLVKQTAQNVADFRNVYESLTTTKFKDTAAVQTFVDVMNEKLSSGGFLDRLTTSLGKKLSVADFGEDNILGSKIKYTEAGSEKEFNIDDFVGSGAKYDNYKPIVFSGITDKVHTRKLQHAVVKVLHKLGLIKIIVADEAFSPESNKYHTCDNVPDFNKGLPQGFDSWYDFLKHCVPADAIEDLTHPKSTSAMLGGALVAAGKALLDTLIGGNLDYRNWNWILREDRNVWDLDANPGMILMSSENGTSTAIVNSAGEVTHSKNYSLGAVLNNMAVDDTEVPAQGPSVSDSYSSMWTSKL